MSQYPPTPPPQPQPGGWDANAGWAPAPPDQGWTPPPQPAGAPGWQTQPGGYGTPPPGMPGGPPVTKSGRGPAIWIALAAVVVAALAGVYFVFLAGGAAEASSPDDVVRSYYNAAVDGDCEAMMDHVDLAAAGTDRQTALGLCNDAYSDGGAVPTKLNSLEVTSESENAATVSVSYESEDGTKTEDVDLNKVDGDWKIDLGNIGAVTDPTTTTTAESTTTTTEEATTTTTETTVSTETPEGSLTPPPADAPEMSDPALAGLANACGGGDMASCDQLFWDSELGGELETYAKTCGGLVPEGGASDQCVSRFGETVAAG